MNKETFNKYKDSILRKAAKVRTAKEEEYFSVSDVISNLRKMAKFRNKETPVMIMDVVAKQLVSISDMVDMEFIGVPADHATIEEWDEKFVDSINYLLKLYASIREVRD